MMKMRMYVLANTAMATLAFCPPDREEICWVAGEPPTWKYRLALSQETKFLKLDIFKITLPPCYILQSVFRQCPNLNLFPYRFKYGYLSFWGSTQIDFFALHFYFSQIETDERTQMLTPNWPSIFLYSSCLWPGRWRCSSSTGHTSRSGSGSAILKTPQGPAGPQSAGWSG